jgi:hypothetical protein
MTSHCCFWYGERVCSCGSRGGDPGILPRTILRAWTGKPEIAHYGAPVICLYTIGNGWVALVPLHITCNLQRGIFACI